MNRTDRETSPACGASLFPAGSPPDAARPVHAATASEQPGAAPAPGARLWTWLRAAVALAVAGKIALAGLSTPGALAQAQPPAPASVPAPGPGLAPAPERATAGAKREATADVAPAPAAAKVASQTTSHPLEARSLLEAIARRQAELDTREKELEARQERLALYQKDVTEKLGHLEEIEGRLRERVEEVAAAPDDAAQSLAKVYGAMKPADAAPILEQLDEATVLRIFARMKEKQVGEILPLMARERAIVLTRSLAAPR